MIGYCKNQYRRTQPGGEVSAQTGEAGTPGVSAPPDVCAPDGQDTQGVGRSEGGGVEGHAPEAQGRGVAARGSQVRDGFDSRRALVPDPEAGIKPGPPSLVPTTDEQKRREPASCRADVYQSDPRATTPEAMSSFDLRSGSALGTESRGGAFVGRSW